MIGKAVKSKVWKIKSELQEEEGGGGGATQVEPAGSAPSSSKKAPSVQEEDRAAVNHRVSTGSVSTSTRREGSSRSETSVSLVSRDIFCPPSRANLNLSSKKAGFITL